LFSHDQEVSAGTAACASGLRPAAATPAGLTLPGLESAEADRSAITLTDHVAAICAAVTAAGRPVVLAVHSGAGVAGYAVTDRVPQELAVIVGGLARSASG
jgi:hypothetical protein